MTCEQHQKRTSVKDFTKIRNRRFLFSCVLAKDRVSFYFVRQSCNNLNLNVRKLLQYIKLNHLLDASDFLWNWGTPSPCSDVRAVLRKGAFFLALSWQHVSALGDIGQRASTMRSAHDIREAALQSSCFMREIMTVLGYKMVVMVLQGIYSYCIFCRCYYSA